MSDPNRLMKWLFVVGLVAIALLILYPPHEKLKGGIDLVGGTSLLYEIDATGLDERQQRDLSKRVMGILKERVDPKGQLNLEWRPVGRTRLEIRMPRPPVEALARRERYNEALERIRQKNLTRYAVESALSASGEERQQRLEGLVRGVTAREPVIESLREAHDAYVAEKAKGDPGAAEEASRRYEEAMSDLLATSLPIARFTDVVSLPAGERRDAELGKLRDEYPAYDVGSKDDPDGRLLTKAVAAYDRWAANKADLEDPSDLKRRLQGAGVLEFRILADRDPNSPGNTRDPNPDLVQPISKYVEQLKKYGPRPKAGDRYLWLPIDDVVNFMNLSTLSEVESAKSNPQQPIVEDYAGRYYVLAHNDPQYSLLHGAGSKSWSLREAYPDSDPMTGKNIVAFRLDPRGGQMFGELTDSNIGRSLCIVLDGTAMSHAVIQSRIAERGQITGNFTVEKVQNLVRILEAGSLPARLKETPLMENTIGPSLGETNRTKGLRAAVWGGVVVALFMLLYYGITAGGIADLALVLTLLFVLAIMAFIQATFTLPGIAGLILTVGMAVDANVLIFERVREERDRGLIFKKALNAGYDKAFSTIIDANLTTLITCIILGFVGSEEVKGFAIVLGIGICTSMFTALFVTRLIFNSLIVWGVLKDFSMRRLVGQPAVDWMGLRRVLWPVSTVMAVAGLAVFVLVSTTRTEATYDIEFLGGTSLQLDLKPGVTMTDEEMTRAVTSDRAGAESAVQWLQQAADQLEAAEVGVGEVAGQFTLKSPTLTGDQIRGLMHQSVEDFMERGGIDVSGHTATFISKPGALTMDRFRETVAQAAQYARRAAERLRSARVQSVGEVDRAKQAGLSYEVATIETNREVVQEAILATVGDKLQVQQSITFTITRDEELTKEPFFAVGAEDHYLSDVIGGDANYDIRRFRGGVALEVVLDASEEPLPKADFGKRLREVGLQPEFERFRSRMWEIYPLDAPSRRPDGVEGHKRFAVVAIDESVLYDEDPLQWVESVARPQLSQVEAALGQEKSLSKVVRFAPQIAGQTQNRAVFAIILALAAIVAYLWLRFGKKEYGLAAIMCLVHDVAFTLGCVGLTQFLYSTVVGRALALDAFRIDLSMIAAVLTVIGYSLNDTIVVFDRIRENKGRVEVLSADMINQSVSQTLSRTILTSGTTLLVVLVLYIFGGAGIHGFSFALLAGVGVGTYSSIAVAAPLLYRQKVLYGVVAVFIALLVVGLVFAVVHQQMVRLILSIVAAGLCLAAIGRVVRRPEYLPAGRPVRA